MRCPKWGKICPEPEVYDPNQKLPCTTCPDTSHTEHRDWEDGSWVIQQRGRKRIRLMNKLIKEEGLTIEEAFASVTKKENKTRVLGQPG